MPKKIAAAGCMVLPRVAHFERKALSSIPCLSPKGFPRGKKGDPKISATVSPYLLVFVLKSLVGRFESHKSLDFVKRPLV